MMCHPVLLFFSFYGSQPGSPYCATTAAAAAVGNGHVNAGAVTTTVHATAGSVWRRGERRITRVALSIVWLFLFCHVWKLVGATCYLSPRVSGFDIRP